MWTNSWQNQRRIFFFYLTDHRNLHCINQYLISQSSEKIMEQTKSIIDFINITGSIIEKTKNIYNKRKD